MSHDVQLNVNAKKFGGWKSIAIDNGMEQIAGAFDLSVTNKWEDEPVVREINPGDLCEVIIDGKVEITGNVDTVDTDYDDKTHTIRVTGRDRTGDLVDCSAAVKQYKNQTLLQIAKDVCKPFNVDVTADADVGAAFADRVVGSGESAYEVIESLARHRGVLMMSNKKGGFVFTRATKTKRAPTALIFGENIMAASGSRDHRDRYHTYKLVSQTPITEGFGGTDATEPTATSIDANIRKERILIIDVDSAQSDLNKRADWEAKVRYARSDVVTYTVLGWGHEDNLWEPNTLVKVKDARNKINDDRLIVHVYRILDEDAGQISEITVMFKNAFDLISIPEEKDSSIGF